MADETTQALLPVTVTQADRDLIVTLMRPLAKSAIEHKAIDFIAEGRGDDAEAVQLVAKHRLAHSLPSQADETSGEMRLRTINHEIRDDLIAAAPETVAFEDLIAWLSTVRHFSWTWTANTRCKYVGIRIDTRRGAFAILDRDGNKITLDELRHQHRAALTKGAE